MLKVYSFLGNGYLHLEGRIIKKVLITDGRHEDRIHIDNGLFSTRTLWMELYKITFETSDKKVVSFNQRINSTLDGKEIENYYETEMKLDSNGEYYDEVLEILNNK